ncbi:hypothetical protein HPP92_006798 [Vanilla planifolia]|uniref:Uncharacterized protein n=1 Tax=Vanilla planifolia TaxID=51239 RepID=A0A835RCV8_VANPL|nr:hypothetical protein HPP92_006798 [Vanilla planifolia]
MEQCKQGKSTKWIRNFGKRIGSEGWARGPNPEPIGCQRTARAACAERAGRCMPVGMVGAAPWGPSRSIEKSTQSGYGHRESDRLIKTKHCDGSRGFSRNVISAQCSECQSEEIQPSAGKLRE